MRTHDIATPGHTAAQASGKRPGIEVTLRKRPAARTVRPARRHARSRGRGAGTRRESRPHTVDTNGTKSALRASSSSTGITWISPDVIRRYRELGHLWEPAETPAAGI